MSPKPPSLPDLDDEEFTQRLKPLEEVVLPHSVEPGSRRLSPQIRSPGIADNRETALPDDRHFEPPKPQDFKAPGLPNTAIPDRRDAFPAHGADTAPTGHSVISPENRKTATPQIGKTGDLDMRAAAFAGLRNGGTPDDRRTGIVSAAERLAQIERSRGPKRRFEYLIPARVGDALADDAARQGKSATTRLLEILREAGYPVIAEDLIDLRKERRR